MVDNPPPDSVSLIYRLGKIVSNSNKGFRAATITMLVLGVLSGAAGAVVYSIARLPSEVWVDRYSKYFQSKSECVNYHVGAVENCSLFSSVDHTNADLLNLSIVLFVLAGLTLVLGFFAWLMGLSAKANSSK